MDSLLVGTWDSDVKDASKIAGCRLQFFGSGELTCTVYVVGQPDYAIRLTYSVNGDVITTRLAFPPQEDQINYSIERDRILVVRQGWLVCRYRRVETEARLPRRDPPALDEPDAPVNAPLKPKQNLRSGAVAPPEPEPEDSLSVVKAPIFPK
jgi:hypothetical protein